MYPSAFHFGSISLNPYGLMVALGFMAGLWTAVRRAPKAGIHPEKVADAGPWLIVGAIAGARALYVLTFWRDQFAGGPISSIFKVWEGGLVYYGGLIGASLACIAYAFTRKLPLWNLADVFAPSIALGQSFGRLGCLFNGCCYGRATLLPWAIEFPQGHATHLSGSTAVRVHPTQIYEALLALVIYIGLAGLFRRRQFHGQVFAAYLVTYAIVRSLVELFRGDYPPDQMFFGGLATPAHLVSVVLLGAGLAAWFVLSRKKNLNAQSTAS